VRSVVRFKETVAVQVHVRFVMEKLILLNDRRERRSMKKVLCGLIVGLVMWVSVGNLVAEEKLNNSVGFRLGMTMPTDSAQWKTGSGYGFYGMFNLNPSTADKSTTYLKASVDFISCDSEVDWLSEGELKIQSLSLSILWGNEIKDGRIYYGFGISKYTNDFEISERAFNEIWDYLEYDYFTYGETLDALEYGEYVDDATGYHVVGGAEIRLSDSAYFQVELMYSIVNTDMGYEYTAEVFDGVDYWIDYDSESKEIDIGGMSFSAGLSIRF